MNLGESWRSVRELPSDVRCVLTAAAVNQLGAVIEGFMVVYLVHVGFGMSAASWAIGMFSLGTLLGALVGAATTEHLGPRTAMVGALTGSGLLVSVVPVAAASHAAPVVLALALILGLSMQAFRPPSSEALSLAVSGHGAVVAFSAFRVAMNAGALIAPLVAAAFIARERWTALFLVDGSTSLLAAALVARAFPRRVRGAEAEREHDKGRGRGWVAMLTERRVLYLVAMLTSGVVYAQTYSVVPLQLSAAGHAPSLYAAMLSIGAVTLVVLELPATTCTRHWPVPAAVLIGTLVFGLSFLLYGVAPRGALLALLACILCVAGTTVSAPRLWSFPAGAPAAVRPVMFAASQTSFGLGMALGPLAGVRAWQSMGQSWWVAVSAIGVVSALAGAYGTRSDVAARGG